MNQEFDPAVELVLDTFERLPGRSGDGSGADAIAGVLLEAADPLGAELARDGHRLRVILDQLGVDGLLEIVPSGSGAQTTRYRLTSLGQARLGRAEGED